MSRTTTYTSTAALAAALDGLVPDIEREVGIAHGDLAGTIAQKASARARSVGGVASHVKVASAGVAVTLTDDRGGRVWAGAEFGGGSRARTRQFQPWRGTRGGGYFLFPTIRDESSAIDERYGQAMDQAMDKL